jgi:protoporphyrinogen oxidase
MQIAILGAGIGGMAAAYDLVKAGHEVTMFEGAGYPGGLAGGFKEPGWQSSVENFYHHWFQTDSDILDLMQEVGLRQKVFFPRPKTVMFYKDKFYPLDSPIAALKFPGYTFPDMVRFGLVSVYLRYLAAWQPLEKYTADEWMRRWYGENLYRLQWEPMLQGKFGPYYKEVNMAWFWARLKARTTRLGTYQGGFQAFADEFAEILAGMGVKILYNTRVEGIRPAENGLTLQLERGELGFDRVLSTTSPAQMAKLAPDLPAEYLGGLLNLKSMGAVVLILALKHQLSKEGYYWYNLPKSAGFPFLALVEHTNFVPVEQFGGDHIIYCGDYLDPSHEYFSLSQEELVERFIPSFKRINPDFSPDWVRAAWLKKTTYAQPVPLLNHSKNIPAIRTPLAGLYFASMSQVYPWDRGTNFAVQIGRQAAWAILKDPSQG